jgi:hypothetical protein
VTRPIEQVMVFWNKRKKKFYNTLLVCIKCQQSSPSKHQKICNACLDRMRNQGLESQDYLKTIESIRSDFYR